MAIHAQDKALRQAFGAVVLLVLAALIFVGLGVWQVRRLAWKEALIAQVARNTAAVPLALGDLPHPVPPALTYRRLTLAGRYEPASTTLVTAATELGSGYWDMAAMRDHASGAILWINRGFVPLGSRRMALVASTPAAPVTVTGLIRFTEPRGTWLRANRPAMDRWYARDLAAMTRARGIMGACSDIFIDAQREIPPPPSGAAAPVPGLTVLTFPNNHLSYAVTWFALALLSVGAAVVIYPRAS